MSYYIGLSVMSNNLVCRGERQKLLSAEARRVLSQLTDAPFAENDIARDGQGRPFLPGSNIDFSISHSGALAAVSLASGKGLRTGCDVEMVRKRPRAKEIAEEFFSVAERDYVASMGNFDEAKFYEIWTLKECFIKLRGLSVFDMAKVPSFICDGKFAFNAPASPFAFYLYDLKAADNRYILATAIEGAEAQPEIRWFSPSDSKENMDKSVKNGYIIACTGKKYGGSL